MAESIHDLFNKVIEHPDFAGGTVFTREDVAYALNRGDDHDEPTDEQIAAVTDDQLALAADAMDAYIFNGSWTWMEAMEMNIRQNEARLAPVRDLPAQG